MFTSRRRPQALNKQKRCAFFERRVLGPQAMFTAEQTSAGFSVFGKRHVYFSERRVLVKADCIRKYLSILVNVYQYTALRTYLPYGTTYRTVLRTCLPIPYDTNMVLRTYPIPPRTYCFGSSFVCWALTFRRHKYEQYAMVPSVNRN